ncbi:MAG TPA: urea ABC transporter permease subunit UrtC [Candidatus Dormibacteraeota bacterium]|nr:urea ABC transporter permease subunit UrtC [Candidatus Dormibacteraeota bacterium]
MSKSRIIKTLLQIVVLIGLLLAPYYLSSYNLSLLGRFLAYAILALGLSLVWGQGGILCLGQGVFFGLGAYALALHLKLAGLGPTDLPDFMVWSGLSNLPWWWKLFHSAAFSFAAVILIPALAAGGLSWLVFRRRVGGVYFALITQALALAFSTLLISEQGYTGGFNGLTDFSTLLGYTVLDPKFQRALYWITVVVLAASFWFLEWLLASNFGKILRAIRDGENRVRFLGYNPVPFKALVFAIGGALAGLSGALFTLHAGVISPANVGVVPSIEMIAWVAVGGRASLVGAVAGTLLVNFGKDWVSNAMPSLWPFVMGLLFVLVVTVVPKGLSGLWDRDSWDWLSRAISRWRSGGQPPASVSSGRNVEHVKKAVGIDVAATPLSEDETR